MNSKGIMGNFGPGFVSDIILKVRLTINLLKDKRVSPWFKLIPAICLVYLIVPLDFLFGPVDDAVILYLGMDWFISLCPAEIVSEYTKQIKGNPDKKEPDDIVDGEFKED